MNFGSFHEHERRGGGEIDKERDRKREMRWRHIERKEHKKKS